MKKCSLCNIKLVNRDHQNSHHFYASMNRKYYYSPIAPNKYDILVCTTCLDKVTTGDVIVPDYIPLEQCRRYAFERLRRKYDVTK